VFWLAPAEARRVLPNTLLLAVRRPGFCNQRARAALERRGVIVGLGAACGARDPAGAANGVLAAMGVHPALHAGVLRVSLGDDTSAADIKLFVRHFLAVVTSEECLAPAKNGQAP
jgi:cysteine desulfurase